MHPMNFGPSWLRSDGNTSQISYDQAEMLTMCHDLHKPTQPPKYKMLLNPEPSLPVSLSPEIDDQIDPVSEVKPEPETKKQYSPNFGTLWRAKCDSDSNSDTNWRSPRKELDNDREWRSSTCNESRNGPSNWRQSLNQQGLPQWSADNSLNGGSFNSCGEFIFDDNKPKENGGASSVHSHDPFRRPPPPTRFNDTAKQQKKSEVQQRELHQLPKQHSRPLYDFVEGVHFTEKPKPADPPKPIPVQTQYVPDPPIPNPLDNWYYRDPQGIVQGPFSTQLLVDWQGRGYFKELMMIWRNGDPRVWTITELSKYGGLVPPVQSFHNHHHANHLNYMNQQQQFMQQHTGFNPMANVMNYYQGTPLAYNPQMENFPYHPQAPQVAQHFPVQQDMRQMYPSEVQGQPQQVDGKFYGNQNIHNSFYGMPSALNPQSAQYALFQQQLTPDICNALIEHLKSIQSASFKPSNINEPEKAFPGVVKVLSSPKLTSADNQMHFQTHLGMSDAKPKMETKPSKEVLYEQSTAYKEEQRKAVSVDSNLSKSQDSPLIKEAKAEVYKPIQKEVPDNLDKELTTDLEKCVIDKDKPHDQQQPPIPLWPVNPNPYFSEIQREELVKKKQIEQKKAKESQQSKPQKSLIWENKENPYMGKSLDVIQAEEDALRKVHQKESEVVRKKTGRSVPTPPKTFADMLSDGNRNIEPNGKVQQLNIKVSKKSPNSKTKQAKPAQNGQNGNIKAKDKIFKASDSPVSKSFMAWCMESLINVKNIDAATFVNFLVQVDSPIEVQEYIEFYLGRSQKTLDFCREFLDRRSAKIRDKHSRKAEKDDLSSANGSWMKQKR